VGPKTDSPPVPVPVGSPPWEEIKKRGKKSTFTPLTENGRRKRRKRQETMRTKARIKRTSHIAHTITRRCEKKPGYKEQDT
jgi:hypothetical protein